MDETVDIPVSKLIWHESTRLSKLAPMMESAINGACFPPIDVITVGSRFLIVDGAHRARVAQATNAASIAATVRDLPRCVEVPGWSHMISESTAWSLVSRHRAPNGAEGIADVVVDGELVNLGPDTTSLGALHLAFHGLGQYIADDLDGSQPRDVLFTWHPPRLDVLVEIALSRSPLPHTVTRFAPLLEPKDEFVALPGRQLVGTP